MQGSDETDGKRRLPRIHFTPRSIAWLIGAAALIAATSAAGLVANGPSSEPTAAAAAADTSSTKNALDAILSRNPDVGQRISALIKSGKLPQPSYAGDTGRVGIPTSATFPSQPAGSSAVYVPGSVNGDFNLLQLSSLALYVGCSPAEAPIAAAIAAAESGGNPGAQGDIALMDGTWDWSQGLWQVRGLRSERGTGGLRDSLANADPEKNGRAMYTISSGCKDWTPWSTYTSGAYLSYLGMSKTAVLAAQQYKQQTGALPSFGTGNTVGVPSASSSSSRSPGKPGTRKPSSGGKSKPPSRHHRKPTSGSSTPAKAPKPGSSSAPVPAATSQAPAPSKTSLPVKLPSLPVKTSLPVKVPSLPVKTSLPVKVPSLPVKLPTSGLPSVPVP
jgi:hypothetical protein